MYSKDSRNFCIEIVNYVKKEAERGCLFYNVKNYLKRAKHLLNVPKCTLLKWAKEFKNNTEKNSCTDKKKVR